MFYCEDTATRYLQMKTEFDFFWVAGEETIYKAICQTENPIGSVIDIACGDGIMIDVLSETFANDPTCGGQFAPPEIKNPVKFLGIDASPTQVESCQKKIYDKNIMVGSYQVGDGNALDKRTDLENQFDIALTCWLFNYAADEDELRRMFKSVHHVLKPGGYCIGFTCAGPKDAIPGTKLYVSDCKQYAIQFMQPQQDAETLIVDYFWTDYQGLKNDFQFSTKWFSKELYKKVCQDTGFDNFNQIPVSNNYRLRNKYIQLMGASKDVLNLANKRQALGDWFWSHYLEFASCFIFKKL